MHVPFTTHFLVPTLVSCSTWCAGYLAKGLKFVGKPDHHDESTTGHWQNHAPTETEIHLPRQRPPRYANFDSNIIAIHRSKYGVCLKFCAIARHLHEDSDLLFLHRSYNSTYPTRQERHELLCHCRGFKGLLSS